jgi:hypothetical protein
MSLWNNKPRMLSREQVYDLLEKAIAQYWSRRGSQQELQGGETGNKDAGLRGEVTGGMHLNGFCELIADVIKASGLQDSEVFLGRGCATLPGYYRPTKDWDIVAVARNRTNVKCLVASVEIKSQAGPSFGNNFNNRVEEALGNASDFWMAYEKGLFPTHPRPFLGYVFLLEEGPKSVCPVKTKSPHFPADPVLENASYRARYIALCERLMRERLYDATALVLSTRPGTTKSQFNEPLQSATIWSFVSALSANAMAFANERSG